ncbi:putative serine/threonine-protein kinase [Capsicum baccatum]|uniref:Serine/threonine-protein kinase n=1 Tax=Capsicum baccatum TaxID=33114 RepID=A0A2G2WMJ9_CAPBA|nr:putative serine/threonine-protein kinase [Capsicum baccatum]
MTLSLNVRSFSTFAASAATTSRLFPISCFGSVGNRKLQCAVFCASLKVRGMAEMIEDNKELNSSTAAATAVTASENDELPHSRAFLDARTGEVEKTSPRKLRPDHPLVGPQILQGSQNLKKPRVISVPLEYSEMEVLELLTMDGREVAVKRLYERNCMRMEQFLNEVEILTRLGHINLVTLYGCSSRCSRELLVYEFIPNGTLADHLHGDSEGSITHVVAQTLQECQWLCIGFFKSSASKVKSLSNLC